MYRSSIKSGHLKKETTRARVRNYKQVSAECSTPILLRRHDSIYHELKKGRSDTFHSSLSQIWQGSQELIVEFVRAVIAASNRLIAKGRCGPRRSPAMAGKKSMILLVNLGGIRPKKLIFQCKPPNQQDVMNQNFRKGVSIYVHTISL